MENPNPYQAPDAAQHLPGDDPRDYTGRFHPLAILAGLGVNICGGGILAGLLMVAVLMWVIATAGFGDPEAAEQQIDAIYDHPAMQALMIAIASIGTALGGMLCAWLARGGELLNFGIYAGCNIVLGIVGVIVLSVLGLTEGMGEIALLLVACVIETAVGFAGAWLILRWRREPA